MANQISLTQKNVEYLRYAFAHFFPEDTIYAADKPFASGEFNWGNRAEFINFVYRLTGIDIKSERDLTNIKKAQLEIEKLVIGNVEEKPVEANTPDKELRESQEAERGKREAELKETKEKAQKDVQASIKRKQEIFEKQKAWDKLQQQKTQTVLSKDNQSGVLNELKGKVVYAVPKSAAQNITLTENEAKFIEIAKNDPSVFSQKLAALIVEKNPDIPPETITPLSQIIAVETTNTLVNPLDRPIPTGVFTSLTGTADVVENLSTTTQSEIAKTTAILTTFSENQNDFYRVILNRSIGKNLTIKVLGFPQEEFNLSLNPQEGAFSVDLSRLQENSFTMQESPVFLSLNSPVIANAQSMANGELKNLAFSKFRSFEGEGLLGSAAKITNSQAFDSIAPFLGVETKSYIGTNFFGKTVTKLFPEYAPLMTNIAGKLGIDVGIKAAAPVVTEAAAKTGGAVVTKGVVGKAIGSAATKVAAKLGLTAAGQAAGSAVPIIGNIIAFVGTEIIGKIASKIPWKKIKEWSAAIVGGVAALIALPFLGIGQAIGIGLGAAGISAAFGGGLGGITLGGIGSGIAAFFGTIFSATLGAIWVPIVATLIGFPLVVVLILFIINSGAYVVPPSTPESPFAAGENGISIICSDEKGPVGVSGPSSSSPIANRAWEIVADLYQGFWCFWNRSPKGPAEIFPNDELLYPPGYPELFDYGKFLSTPNPDPYSGVNLFWCTYLPIKAYTENGISIQPNVYTPSMYNDFNSRGKILDATKATPQNLLPGSVVFFHVTSGQNRLNHVGVVYSVDPGGIVLVESNAPLKSQTINFKTGGGVGNLPGMEVKYFGLP